MQGISFEEYAVTWESDFSKVIWLFEIEGNWRDVQPFKKVCVKSARDVTHVMALIENALEKALGESVLGQSTGKGKS